MIGDQDEIDSLLEQADGLAAEADQAAAAQAVAPDSASPTPQLAATPELQRILKLRVPVIVQLATRTMPLLAVRDLSVGAIIEFEKSVDKPLDLLVNNHKIGEGRCVKVGENFGLHIVCISDPRQRICSMGSPQSLGA